MGCVSSTGTESSFVYLVNTPQTAEDDVMETITSEFVRIRIRHNSLLHVSCLFNLIPITNTLLVQLETNCISQNSLHQHPGNRYDHVESHLDILNGQYITQWVCFGFLKHLLGYAYAYNSSFTRSEQRGHINVFTRISASQTSVDQPCVNLQTRSVLSFKLNRFDTSCRCITEWQTVRKYPTLCQHSQEGEFLSGLSSAAERPDISLTWWQ